MMNQYTTRRDILKSGLGLTAGLALPHWFRQEVLAQPVFDPEKSPNERPGILLVGCGGMGRADARSAAAFGKILAVCDPDQQRVDEAAREFQAEAAYRDFRRAMTHKGIDVIINGTPDHWHTLINLHALRAGKDVYCEKPLTLTIDEGKKLVAVARESGRILQTGSQQRSDARFRLACELVRNGRIGTLKRIISTLPTGLSGGPFQSQPVPPELDWNLWQGQAPEMDYVKERCHMTFRFWYDYSGGTLTDWGAHHNDIAQWGNGTERSGPVSVEGRVLQRPVAGGYTAYAHYELTYEYANGVQLLCRNIPHETFTGAVVPELKTSDARNGIRFEGTDGWIFVTRGGIEASQPEFLSQELPAGALRLYVSNHHMGNFFECVRSRRPPICEPEIGHRSATVCHLGVIALRVGGKLTWNPDREEFVNNAEANRHVAREMRAPWSYETV
ncbi:MAG: Gfo/Idh/MocA family protein [Planctomycetales bacterium]